MKHYQILYNYAHGDDLMFAVFDEAELSFGRYDVYKNMELPVEQIYCSIAEDQTEECDYIANNLAWFVISEKAKNIFEQFNLCKCQYIKVIDKATNALIGYLVNCLESYDALDIEHSVGYYDSYGFTAIKYAIKEEKLHGVDFFQIEEPISPLFISERIRKQLKQSKVKGFDYSLITTT